MSLIAAKSIDGGQIIIKKRERESELRDSIQNITKIVKKRSGLFDAEAASEIETILSMIANKLIINKEAGRGGYAENDSYTSRSV